MTALEMPNPETRHLRDRTTPRALFDPHLVMVACPACKGRGARNWSFHVPVPCLACNGLGRVSVVRAAVIKQGR